MKDFLPKKSANIGSNMTQSWDRNRTKSSILEDNYREPYGCNGTDLQNFQRSFQEKKIMYKEN